jgi:hypothetical protein
MQLATKDYRRTTLRPRHRPVVRALAEALLAPDGEMDDARLEAFVVEVDQFISPASKTLRFGLKMILDLIRWTPLLLGFRFRPFEELSVDERIHHLERLEASRIAQLPLLVVSYKTLMSSLFYEDERELAGIGYSHDRKTYKRGLALAPAASVGAPVAAETPGSPAGAAPTPAELRAEVAG